MAAQTVGKFTVEIIYCANDKAKNEPRNDPEKCALDMATKLEAFRATHGTPTSIEGFTSRTPQGADVFGAVVIFQAP